MRFLWGFWGGFEGRFCDRWVGRGGWRGRGYVFFLLLLLSLRGGGGANLRVGINQTLAKNLLTLSYRLDELSTLLLIHPSPSSSSPTTTTAAVSIPNFDDDQEGSSSGGGGGGGGGESSTPSIPRLSRILLGYLFVTRNLLPKLPPQHPFVKMQIPRIEAVRKTLLLDLDSALKEARSSKDSDRVLVLLGFYADLDAEAEGVRALKEGGKVGK